MRNKQMLKKISVKCATAILSAAMLMSSAAVTVAFPLTVYAEVQENDDGSVRVYSEGEPVDVNVGDVDANTTENNTPALDVDARSPEVSVTVTADSVENDNPNGGGLGVEADHNSTSNVTVDSVESGGISAQAQGGGSNTINVGDNTGNITASSSSGGSNTISVGENTGNITVAATDEGSKNTVTIGNEKDDPREPSADIINAGSANKGSNTVDVSGSVNTVNANADGGGSNVVNVGGNANNINEISDNGGFNTVSVAGGTLQISATSNNNGSNDVSVAGDAAIINTGAQNGGSNTVIVDGDVQIAITATSLSGENTIKVGGDVGGSNSETGLGLRSEGSGKNNIVIEGTLNVKDGGTPILLSQTTTEENLKITVWKIEIGGNQATKGNIVREADGGSQQTETAKEVEKNINYIIKIDPTQTGILSSYTKTAKADESVTITVFIPEDQILIAVYTDKGKELMAQDNGDATYTFIVPVGGGVYVHAEFVEIPPEPEPNSNKNPSSKSNNNDNSETQQNLLAGNKNFVIDLGNGARQTLYASNIQALILLGIQNFVFTINGKTYTIKAEDLLTWLADSLYIAIYADGDKLVLEFGDGRLIKLDSDEVLKGGTNPQTADVINPTVNQVTLGPPSGSGSKAQDPNSKQAETLSTELVRNFLQNKYGPTAREEGALAFPEDLDLISGASKIFVDAYEKAYIDALVADQSFEGAKAAAITVATNVLLAAIENSTP